MFKKTLKLAFIALISGTVCATAQGLASREAKIEIVSNQNLSARQQAQFERFASEASYFGAFYASSNGASAWRRDLNTLEAAEVLAELGCESEGADCSLYATMVPEAPEGRRPFDKLAMSLSADAVFWIRSQRGQTSGAAIAASGYWGYSSTVRGRGIRQAERDARRSCQQRLEDRVSDWLEPNEIAALQDADLLDCKIIVSIRGR